MVSLYYHHFINMSTIFFIFILLFVKSNTKTFYHSALGSNKKQKNVIHFLFFATQNYGAYKNINRLSRHNRFAFISRPIDIFIMLNAEQ